MNDKQFENILEFVYMGGGFIPYNEKANELAEQCTKGQVIGLNEVTARDLSFHNCYHALLSYVWGYMPASFKKKVPQNFFYKWLKHLRGQYEIKFEFKDGTKLIEYESIAFGNMSQIRFKTYVKEQMPYIYENVIGAFFEGEIKDNIIQTIEADFERFFDKLN